MVLLAGESHKEGVSGGGGGPSYPPRPEHEAAAHPGSAELAASVAAALEPRSSVDSVGSSGSAAGACTILLHC